MSGDEQRFSAAYFAVVQQLSALQEKLDAFAKLYESGDLDFQRTAVRSALCAVADYLEAQGVEPAALLPIMRPALALVERENNALDQMFTQRARGGRPKATVNEHERTGILAAFADAWLLLDSPNKRPQATKLAVVAP